MPNKERERVAREAAVRIGKASQVDAEELGDSDGYSWIGTDRIEKYIIEALENEPEAAPETEGPGPRLESEKTPYINTRTGAKPEEPETFSDLCKEELIEELESLCGRNMRPLDIENEIKETKFRIGAIQKDLDDPDDFLQKHIDRKGYERRIEMEKGLLEKLEKLKASEELAANRSVYEPEAREPEPYDPIQDPEYPNFTTVEAAEQWAKNAIENRKNEKREEYRELLDKRLNAIEEKIGKIDRELLDISFPDKNGMSEDEQARYSRPLFKKTEKRDANE